MKRTQLLLPPKLKSQLQQEAQRQGISMGELVRELIKDGLKSKNYGVTSLERLAKYAKGGTGKKITSENFRQHYPELLGYK